MRVSTYKFIARSCLALSLLTFAPVVHAQTCAATWQVDGEKQYCGGITEGCISSYGVHVGDCCDSDQIGNSLYCVPNASGIQSNVPFCTSDYLTCKGSVPFGGPACSYPSCGPTTISWKAQPANDLDDFTCPAGTRLKTTGGRWYSGGNFNEVACGSSANFIRDWPTAGTMMCEPDASCAMAPKPTATLWAPALVIPYNTSTTLNWSSTNASSCFAPSGNWAPSPALGPGSVSTGNLISNTAYSYQCQGADSSLSPIATVNISVLPKFEITTPNTQTIKLPNTVFTQVFSIAGLDGTTVCSLLDFNANFLTWIPCSGSLTYNTGNTPQTYGYFIAATKMSTWENDRKYFEVVVQPADCDPATIANCSLSKVGSGSSSGSCTGGTTGSCSYVCANGSWQITSNACKIPAALSVQNQGDQTITLPTIQFTETYSVSNGSASVQCALLDNNKNLLVPLAPCSNSFTYNTPGAANMTYGYYIRAYDPANNSYSADSYFRISVQNGTCQNNATNFPACDACTLPAVWDGSACTMPGSCPAGTQGSNCTVAQTTIGATSGSCQAGYTGTCSYECKLSGWSFVANSCQQQGNADLRPSGTIVENSAIRDTDNIFSIMVQNIGSAATNGVFPVLLQRSPDANLNNAYDVKMVANQGPLGPGGSGSDSQLVRFTYNPGKPVGTMYLRACVNKQSAAQFGPVQESNYNNNCSALVPVNITGMSCGLPWGGVLADNGQVTAYSAASGPICSSENRVCNNGTLSGSFANQSCSACNNNGSCDAGETAVSCPGDCSVAEVPSGVSSCQATTITGSSCTGSIVEQQDLPISVQDWTDLVSNTKMPKASYDFCNLAGASCCMAQPRRDYDTNLFSAQTFAYKDTPLSTTFGSVPSSNDTSSTRALKCYPTAEAVPPGVVFNIQKGNPAPPVTFKVHNTSDRTINVLAFSVPAIGSAGSLQVQYADQLPIVLAPGAFSKDVTVSWASPTASFGSVSLAATIADHTDIRNLSSTLNVPVNGILRDAATTVQLTANPTKIKDTNSTTLLTWSTENVDSCIMYKNGIAMKEGDDVYWTNNPTGGLALNNQVGKTVDKLGLHTVFKLVCKKSSAMASSTATVLVTPTFLEY